MASRSRMLSVRELLRILHELGFEVARQKGSHLFLRHPDGRTTVVPHHSGDIGRGLLRQILKDIEMAPEEFGEWV